MDLERIKQNLRLRSGRAKKPKKSQAPSNFQQPTPAAAPASAVKPPPLDAPVSRQPPTPPPSLPASERSPRHTGEKQEYRQDPQALPNLEPLKAPSHRPQLSHAVTARDSPGAPERYGRSGIEKPQINRPSQPPALPNRTMTDPGHSTSDDAADFDLRPPEPRPQAPSLELTSELLFSPGHLNFLLQEPQSVAKFSSFLARYKPEYQPLIFRYLETQKAIKAVEYANAVAQGFSDLQDASADLFRAATLNQAFAESSAKAFDALVGTALPMYVTYSLVKLVSECLVNEITGRQSPIMRGLVGGLSEVFCITDPNKADNPIIYASEEFYRLTGYGRDDVIGHNCRFLQGRKTIRDSPRRLKEATQKGEEHCETLLNYRRDGRPFVNLLMIAPLHDDKGKVKYQIGAQVDVSGLVEGGRGLDDFERYLARRRDVRYGRRNGDAKKKSTALKKLQELSEMFDLEESAVVQSSSRSSSVTRGNDRDSVASTERKQRRVFVDTDQDDDMDEVGERTDKDDEKDNDTWKLGQGGLSGPSGKLPGIYDSYMLIRAAPSLRIIFVSPKLRKVGRVVQSPFMSHVAAPATTLAGLKESFNTGTPVSAKINFMPQAGKERDGVKMAPGVKIEDEKYGKTCWISATPMLGSDDRVGVWMVVVVEKAKARRSQRTAEVEAKLRTPSSQRRNRPSRIDLPRRESRKQASPEIQQLPKEDMPIKPKRLDDLYRDSEQEEEIRRYEQPLSAIDGTKAQLRQHVRDSEDDSDFVQPKPVPEPISRKDRVHIEPDSEEDQGSPEWQAAPQNHHEVNSSPRAESPPPQNPEHTYHQHASVSRNHITTPHVDSADHDIEPDPQLDLARKYTPPPEIPKSMQNATPPPRTPDVNVEEETPTRKRFDDESADDISDTEHVEEQTTPSGTARPTPTARPSEMSPMDYLRHPGSGGRGGGGGGGGGGGFRSEGEGDDRWTDYDCMRSPYSVD